MAVTWKYCEKCNGTGKIKGKDCKECEGTGYLIIQEESKKKEKKK